MSQLSKLKHSTGKMGYVWKEVFVVHLMDKYEIIGHSLSTNGWMEREEEKKGRERCEIRNKLTSQQKKNERERQRKREREKRVSSSQRIDEKNYWFDRKRKWVRADVEWIEEKDKSSLIERRRHAVKEKLTRVLFPFFLSFLIEPEYLAVHSNEKNK